MALVVLNMIYKKEDIIAILKWKKVKWARKVRILALMLMSFERNERFKRKVKNRRRPRGYAVEEMNHLREAEFRKMFRLSRQSFNTMLMKVSRRLRVRDEKQAKCSSGSSISNKTRLAVTLRWLAGGSHSDLCFAFGISSTSFFKEDGVLWETIRALDAEYNLSFPLDSISTLQCLGDEFGRYSNGAMQNAVGAIDGLVIRTRCPFLSETSNPMHFRNRKGTFGLLALGISDLNGRFLMFTVNHPGSTHDSLAWQSCALKLRIDAGELPEQFFLIGDEAFQCTEQMLSPYPGQGIGRWPDSFNYHLSKCRQSIERAFGMLVRRWGVLQRKLACDFERWPLVAVVCAKLHNVCCDANIPVPDRWTEDIRPNDLPVVYLNDQAVQEVRGRSTRRHTIQLFLQSRGQGRPQHSVMSRE